MAKMTGWQAVVNALKMEGIKFVYGLPSSPEDLYDDLYDESSIKAIQVRHEAAGGFMAMAEALATGLPAVCYASEGPGVMHLTAPLLESAATCAPVIAIAPGVDALKDGKGAFQETDQVGIMKPIVKWSVKIPHPAKIPWVMHRAFYLATNGQPGPIFIELPQNVSRAVAEIPDYVPAKRYIRTMGDPSLVRQAVDIISEAKRPLIVAGGGARRSGAHDEIKALAERLGAPIMTTPSGRGIIEEDHPLAFGQVGMYRNRLGIDTYHDADLVITVGSRNEEFQTGSWTHKAEDAKLIQIDIEAFELSRNWIPDVAILGDAKLVTTSILDMITDQPQWDERKKANMEKKKALEAAVAEECKIDERPIRSKRVVYELNQVFGKNTIMVHENGSQDLWSYYSPYYKVLDRNGDIAPGEQTCMGAGVMGAVGVKLAMPDKKVVCVTGDGAFQMYNQDVPTAVQHNAPITWVILNSFSFGWPKRGQVTLGNRFIATNFEVQPDFVAMAEAYGCYGERVENPDNLQGAFQRALEANNAGQPAILDIIVDETEVGPAFVAYETAKKVK